MNDAQKLAAIRARLELLEDPNADKWGSQPGYAIEDIGRILDDQDPMSTKDVTSCECGLFTAPNPV